MDFFIQRWRVVNVQTLLCVLCFMPFSAFASSSSPFIEFNIALVIGMSVPVLLISGLLKSKIHFAKRILVLLALSLVGLLYSTHYIHENQTAILLTCASMYLGLSYFWLVSSKNEESFDFAMISHVIVLITLSAFIAILWLFPTVDAYLTWGVVSALVVAISAVRIKYISQGSRSLLYKLIIQWALVACFAGAVFLWINAKLSSDWLVLTSVLCFFISVINSCWMIVRSLTKPLMTNELDAQDERKLPSDAATNLPSQQQAMTKISHVLKNNPTKKYAVITFKPINFQQVNKVLGHHNSDILLLQLAYSLQKTVSDNERLLNFNDEKSPIRIARLQGLHFLVVLEFDEEGESKRLVIEKLCNELTLAVPDAMSFKSFSLNFELTFGIALMGEHGNSLSQVISHAEDALLTAENSQLPFSYFDNEEVIYTERHLLKMEQLKQDIIDDSLEWLVQPQTRLRDRKLVGFEITVQWYNKSETPLQLHEFIETAEHSGEIYLLTKQMITRAFKLILKLQRLSVYETVSIKLLSQYLLEPDLVSFIEKQIAKYNVPAEYLVIELPENIVLSASEKAKITIDELKSLKVNIGIADFSGSYESLRYIRKMAVHQVKIDCANIAATGEEDSENAIVTALIDLTQKMELPLIGTSIDNKQIEQAFTLIGGELAQGAVVEQGVGIDKIDTWVNTWNGLYNPV